MIPCAIVANKTATARESFVAFKVTHVTVNRDLCCFPHVDANGGPSYIAFFGNFTGGELCLEGGRLLGGPRQRLRWCKFDGRLEHWNLPHQGTKLTVVAYDKPVPRRPPWCSRPRAGRQFDTLDALAWMRSAAHAWK